MSLTILDLPTDILFLLCQRQYLDVASSRNFMLSSIKIYRSVPSKFRYSRLHLNERSGWRSRVYWEKKKFEGDQCYICMGEKRFCDRRSAIMFLEGHLWVNIPSFKCNDVSVNLKWMIVKSRAFPIMDWDEVIRDYTFEEICIKITEYMDKQIGL